MTRHRERARRRGAHVLAVVAGILVSIVSGASGESVWADHTDGYYARHWDIDPLTRFGFLEAELGGGGEIVFSEARLASARTEWNSVVDSTFDFAGYLGYNPSVVWTGSTCTTGSVNTVSIMSVAGIGVAGSTSQCIDGANFDRMAIRLNSNLTWFNGSSGDIPSGQYDLWALITHELGHSSGFGMGSGVSVHFSGSRVCPGGDDPAQSTMCAGSPLVRFWRSLRWHDETVIAFEY